ncbi:peptidase T [Fusobacterium sp. PH5-44]|uniref:peptidase T n=1 Tax=unclassified Fusobacterium TaxID=2648384 RepID=UPI003D1C093F
MAKLLKKENKTNSDVDQMIERFLKYITIDSESNPESQKCPSTPEQMNIAKIIAKDLKDIGFTDVSVDKNGYVMGTLAGNVKKVPTIGFIAHMDTVHTFSGKGVKPQIIENYKGGDIVLNKKEKIVLSPNDFPNLNNYIGQKLVVTDGTTVLGADDKAGIVEIIEALKYIKENPEIKHGTIKIGFTPDEEIGRGADLFDVKKFGCDFAYTIDGGELGELEYENFNAAFAVIDIQGRDIHPGRSKDKMINSMMIAMELHGMLPVSQRPEYTEGYEGFYLLMKLIGSVENTQMKYIIRDHSKEKFEEKKELLEKTVEYMSSKYKSAKIKLEMKDSYYNMEEKIRPVMEIVELAKKSMEEIGVTPLIKSIRGGTDGARLSYMGLPCPNIFTGGENFHGKYEFISVNAMEKAKNVIIKIIENVPEFKMNKK